MSLWLMVVTVCTLLKEAEWASRLSLHSLNGDIMTKFFLETPRRGSFLKCHQRLVKCNISGLLSPWLPLYSNVCNALLTILVCFGSQQFISASYGQSTSYRGGQPCDLTPYPLPGHLKTCCFGVGSHDFTCISLPILNLSKEEFVFILNLINLWIMELSYGPISIVRQDSFLP